MGHEHIGTSVEKGQRSRQWGELCACIAGFRKRLNYTMSDVLRQARDGAHHLEVRSRR